MMRRSKASDLWKNLTQGDSFRDAQLGKWRKNGSLTMMELGMIEAGCKSEMLRLGYKTESDPEPKFSLEDIAEFKKQNEEGKKLKNLRLKETNKQDYESRQALEKVSDFYSNPNNVQVASKWNFNNPETNGQKICHIGKLLLQQSICYSLNVMCTYMVHSLQNPLSCLQMSV